MILLYLILLSGAVAGLHSASWGSYRDSPYESFSRMKFTRSIIIGGIIGLVAFFVLPGYGITIANLGIISVFVMGFERVFTESLKVFFREEDEKKYKIPMRFHYFGNIIKSRARRIVIGAGFLAGSFLLFHVLAIFLPETSLIFNLSIGLLAGIGVAFCGAWRAAPFEGFRRKKFFKSPIAGLVSGAVLGPFSMHYALLFFGSIGMLHMILQLIKIAILPVTGESPPSKFGDEKKPVFPKYLASRKIIILPYGFSWLFFIGALIA